MFGPEHTQTLQSTGFRMPDGACGKRVIRQSLSAGKQPAVRMNSQTLSPAGMTEDGPFFSAHQQILFTQTDGAGPAGVNRIQDFGHGFYAICQGPAVGKIPIR
jgi:hypothetical protein